MMNWSIIILNPDVSAIILRRSGTGISFTLIVLCAAVGVLIESVWIPGKYRTFFVSGQWKDGDLKRGWYCLLNEAGPGRKKAYPTALLLYVLIMAVITGMRPTVQSTCATQLGGVLTLQILFAALVMYLKPLRSKWLRYHTIVMIIFQLCFAAVMLFRARNIASEITIGAQGLNGLLAVCVITNILFVVVACTQVYFFKEKVYFIFICFPTIC